jgi:AcrR family transcriptional regulator
MDRSEAGRAPPDIIEGIVPPRQQRGARSEKALLEAARRLLKRHHFDALKIDAICAAAGLTTGAFYRRFAGKEILLHSLQAAAYRDAVDGVRRIEAELEDQRGHAEAQLDIFLRAMLRWCRANQGVLRTTLQRATSARREWTPFRRIPRLAQEILAEPLFGSLGVRRSRQAERAFAAAFQLAAGAVINMIINDPGPMRLRDRELAADLRDAMLGYLQRKVGT